MVRRGALLMITLGALAMACALYLYSSTTIGLH